MSKNRSKCRVMAERRNHPHWTDGEGGRGRPEGVRDTRSRKREPGSGTHGPKVDNVASGNLLAANLPFPCEARILPAVWGLVPVPPATLQAPDDSFVSKHGATTVWVPCRGRKRPHRNLSRGKCYHMYPEGIRPRRELQGQASSGPEDRDDLGGAH